MFIYLTTVKVFSMHFDRSKQIYLQLHSSIAVRLHRPKRTQRVSVVAAVMFGSFLERYSLEAFHQSLWHVPQGGSTVIISSSRKSKVRTLPDRSLFTSSQIIIHTITDHCSHHLITTSVATYQQNVWSADAVDIRQLIKAPCWHGLSDKVICKVKG